MTVSAAARKRKELDDDASLVGAAAQFGIDNGRRSFEPGFGMNTRRAANGRYLSSRQFTGQLVQEPGHPVLLDHGQRGSVDASRAAVTAHITPRPRQDVSAEDLVRTEWNRRPGSALAAR